MNYSEEIEALRSIYPEIKQEHKNTLVLELNIEPYQPVKVVFKTTGLSQDFHHLPPATLRFTIPDGYPLKSPPQLELSTCWLDVTRLRQIEMQLIDLWDHDSALFDMIDQGKTLLESTVDLELAESLKPILTRYEVLADQQEFDSFPFLCQICQYHRRGQFCTKLSNCHDVFCTDCLKEYYSACVHQGYVNQVICPEPNCKAPSLAPVDLEKLLDSDQIQRLQHIKRKLILESDPNRAIICPSYVCEALIRRNPDDNLTICPECNLAFCGICMRSWHGYFEHCRIQEPTRDILEEYVNGDASVRRDIECKWGKLNMRHFERSYIADRQFYEYMEKSNSKACPKCMAPIEKSTGCNKMTCAICHTYFCFICSMTLDYQHPYEHYQTKGSKCYQKLFEGVDVDALNEQIGPMILD